MRVVTPEFLQVPITAQVVIRPPLEPCSFEVHWMLPVLRQAGYHRQSNRTDTTATSSIAGRSVCSSLFRIGSPSRATSEASTREAESAPRTTSGPRVKFSPTQDLRGRQLEFELGMSS